LITFTLANKGSTGTGTTYTPLTGGLERCNRVGLEFEVEAVGATPTITFTIEALMADLTTWGPLAFVTSDSSVAASNAAIGPLTATGKTFRYVAGLDYRFIRGLRVNVSANTNVTFSCRGYGLPD